jgi:RimJ/RimL family protein N-acetyltransferase
MFGMASLRQNQLIYLLIQEGNTASQNVAMKLGMNEERRVEFSGKNVDVYVVTN